MKEIKIGNKTIYVSSSFIESDKKFINKIHLFNRKDCYAIGLKSKKKFISILKKNGLDSKSLVYRPQEPSIKFARYGFNDFEDRYEKRLYEDEYPKLIEHYNSLPDDLFIYID